MDRTQQLAGSIREGAARARHLREWRPGRFIIARRDARDAEQVGSLVVSGGEAKRRQQRPFGAGMVAPLNRRPPEDGMRGGEHLATDRRPLVWSERRRRHGRLEQPYRGTSAPFCQRRLALLDGKVSHHRQQRNVFGKETQRPSSPIQSASGVTCLEAGPRRDLVGLTQQNRPRVLGDEAGGEIALRPRVGGVPHPKEPRALHRVGDLVGDRLGLRNGAGLPHRHRGCPGHGQQQHDDYRGRQQGHEHRDAVNTMPKFRAVEVRVSAPGPLRSRDCPMRRVPPLDAVDSEPARGL